MDLRSLPRGSALPQKRRSQLLGLIELVGGVAPASRRLRKSRAILYRALKGEPLYPATTASICAGLDSFLADGDRGAA
jgi:hypothetical protein